MITKARVQTLDEFLRLPEAQPALEYDRGVVTQKMSPKTRHGALQMHLGLLIDGFAKPRQLGRVFSEGRVVYRFADRSYVPDLVVYRWGRIPVGPDGRLVDQNFEWPPDIAIEILSPGQSRPSAMKRSAWYAANGAPVAILLTPDDERVFVFRGRRPAAVITGDDRIDLEDVLPGFGLTAHEIFAGLRLS